MRILFGTDYFYPDVYGAANFAYGLAKELAKKGHDIFVMAPSREFKYTVTKHKGITIYGIPSVMIPKIIHPIGMRVSPISSSSRITALTKEINPDVIHIQDHFMIGNKVAHAGKQLGIPIVGTNHFMPENFLHYIPTLGFTKKPISKLAWKQFVKLYRDFDLITTPTKTAARLIANLGINKPIMAISCGIDLQLFNPKKDGRYLKKRYKISDTKPVVLFVGRLDREKYIDVVIKAFAIVLKSADAQLVIAGKGKERTKLVKLAKKLKIDKDVIFTGFIPDQDLPSFYRMADVFAIASIAELQSIATMEALASGLPVVAAEVMALPELVHHGKNGYLFNQGDSQTLASHIIKIIQNPSLKKKMAENSLKIISQHKLDKTIKSYENIYRKLIATFKKTNFRPI